MPQRPARFRSSETNVATHCSFFEGKEALYAAVLERAVLSADSLVKQVQVIAAAGEHGVRGFSDSD